MIYVDFLSFLARSSSVRKCPTMDVRKEGQGPMIFLQSASGIMHFGELNPVIESI
jgi:hypothetical protein